MGEVRESEDLDAWPPEPVEVAPDRRPLLRLVLLVAVLVVIGAAIAVTLTMASGAAFMVLLRAAIERWAWG